MAKLGLHTERKTPFVYGGLLVLARTIPIIPVALAGLLLPAEQFGALAVLVTSVTTAMLVADSGTDNAAGWLASHAKSSGESQRILSALVYSRVSIAAAATLLLTAPQTPLLPGDGRTGGLVLVAAIVSNSVASFNAARRVRMRIEGNDEPRAILLEKITIGLVFVAWVSVLPHSASWIMWGYLVSILIGPLVAFKPMSLNELACSFADIRRLLIQAAPFVVTTLSAALTWRVSTFILAHNDQLEQAAYLTLALYPVQLFASIPAASAPLMLIKRKVKEISFRTTAVSGLIMGALLAFALLTGTFLIALIGFADRVDRDAITSLRVLLIAMPFLWVNPVLASYLRLRSGPWHPTYTIVACGIVSVVLATQLAPRYGAVGASGVITGSEILSFCFLLMLALRCHRVIRNDTGGLSSGLREGSLREPS